MASQKLMQFRSNEIVLSSEEARIVLHFIFETPDLHLINSLSMTDARGFAQALLIDAINTSSAMSSIGKFFRSPLETTQGIALILRNLSRVGKKEWFNKPARKNLSNIKIYQFVLDNISADYREQLSKFTVQNRLKKASMMT